MSVSVLNARNDEGKTAGVPASFEEAALKIRRPSSLEVLMMLAERGGQLEGLENVQPVPSRLPEKRGAHSESPAHLCLCTLLEVACTSDRTWEGY